MLREFIDFVDSVLPSVSPNFRDGAKEAIYQFEKAGKEVNYLTSNVLEELSQGDIISKVPFSYFNNIGKQITFVADAMVISTSCHIDQKDKIILAPILPLSEFSGDLASLKRNTIFDFMYIPDPKTLNQYICFSILGTYSKELVMHAIKIDRIKRVASLNQIGYYFFIIKLSVYLMRKEDGETLGERNILFSY